MSEQIFGFDAESIRKLRADHRRLAAIPRNTQPLIARRREARNDQDMTIRVRNDSGEIIPAWGVMRITGSLTYEGRRIYKVAKPSTTFAREYLVNGNIAIPVGGYGRIERTETTRVLRDPGTTPAAGEGWGPVAGQWYVGQWKPETALVMGDYGDDSTLLCEWHDIDRVLGKADSAISVGSSGTVSVWAGDAGSEIDTTVNVTGVANKFTAIDSGDWVEILWLHGVPYLIKAGSGVSLALVQLTGALSQGGTANGTLCQWNGAAWVATGSSVTVYDSPNYGPVASGKRVIVAYSTASSRQEILSVPPGSGSQLVPIYLNADLTKGGSAGATIRQWNGGASAWQTTGATITVYDPEDLGPANMSDLGWCELNTESNRYEMVSIPRRNVARRVEFTCVQSMAREEIITVVSATLFYDGNAPFEVPGLLTVRNSRKIFQGENGLKGVAVYKPELECWEIDWVQCPGKTVKPSYPNAPEGNYTPSVSSYSGEGAAYSSSGSMGGEVMPSAGFF